MRGALLREWSAMGGEERGAVRSYLLAYLVAR
jgi:hypothetical protein